MFVALISGKVEAGGVKGKKGVQRGRSEGKVIIEAGREWRDEVLKGERGRKRKGKKIGRSRE